jgi:hypothetical protein
MHIYAPETNGYDTLMLQICYMWQRLVKICSGQKVENKVESSTNYIFFTKPHDFITIYEHKSIFCSNFAHDSF